MPRVAHVISTPSGVGGAERIVAALVHGAQSRGWEPLLVNPFAEEPHESDLARLCAPARYVGRGCNSRLELPRLRRWLQETLTTFRPDIVHAHLVHAGIGTATLRLPAVAASVFTHHHGDHLVVERRLLLARLDRWAGRRFDRVVAVSEAVQRFLVSTYGYEQSRVPVITNGWTGRPLPAESGGPPTIVCVANLRPQKGHSVLLDAFARIREDLPSARLVLIGDGPLRPQLERHAIELGVADGVEFRGSVDNVWPELARADVFGLASLHEPLGIAVLEAMAAGLPVVATAVGGIPELVTPETGVLVPAGDPAALATAMGRLLTSRKLQERLGAAGKARAAGMRMESTSDRYLALYGELLGGDLVR